MPYHPPMARTEFDRLTRVAREKGFVLLQRTVDRLVRERKAGQLRDDLFERVVRDVYLDCSAEGH